MRQESFEISEGYYQTEKIKNKIAKTKESTTYACTNLVQRISDTINGWWGGNCGGWKTVAKICKKC